jgi:CRISPR/Cas system-associated protein Cas10 (large subunit of type III CRISPR-Cas system)
MKKRCIHCRQAKNKDCFSQHACRPDGLRDYCRDCARIARKAWEQRNPDKVRAISRRKYYKRAYALTAEKRKTILANGNRCAICEGTRDLIIDHCHKTGKIRGVLCGHCNRAIGFLRDKPSLAFRAGLYLLEQL